jgi:hypothetical protein
MRKDKYIEGLKRELAGRGKRNPVAADAIMRELAANGVETRTSAEQKPKRAASKPKADADSEE